MPAQPAQFATHLRGYAFCSGIGCLFSSPVDARCLCVCDSPCHGFKQSVDGYVVFDRIDDVMQGLGVEHGAMGKAPAVESFAHREDVHVVTGKRQDARFGFGQRAQARRCCAFNQSIGGPG